MILKTIPQDLVFKLRKEYKDSLVDDYKKERAYFEKIKCPRCNTLMTPKLNKDKPFSEGRDLPNMLLDCAQCKIEIEPYTGVITKYGKGGDLLIN